MTESPPSPVPRVAAILLAGGTGTRAGFVQPKQLELLGGKPVLRWSLDAFEAHPAISRGILVANGDVVTSMGAIGDRWIPADPGAERQQSVANALHALSEWDDEALVLIHDAARPFASESLVSRTIDAAVETGAALAALPARDTVKRAEGGSANAAGPAEAGPYTAGPYVLETLPRDTIHLAQTPQAFRRDVLASALAYGARGGIDATDEATLAERAGHQVRLGELPSG